MGLTIALYGVITLHAALGGLGFTRLIGVGPGLAFIAFLCLGVFRVDNGLKPTEPAPGHNPRLKPHAPIDSKDGLECRRYRPGAVSKL